MIEIRDYQAEDRDKVLNAWKTHRNVILTEPTGAGKTIIMVSVVVELLRRNENGVIVIAAHRDFLLSQMSVALCLFEIEHTFISSREAIKNITDIHIEEFQRSFYNPSSNVVVVSVDTFMSRQKRGALGSFPGLVSHWFLDETHHCLKENKWGGMVNTFVNARGLGLTATPLRADGKGLGVEFHGVFDHLIVGRTVGELIELGYLSPYKIYVPPTLLDVSGLGKTKSGDYNQNKLAERTDKIKITGDAVKQYLKYGSMKPAITFCVNIAHAEHVASEFNRHNIPSIALSSKQSITERNEWIKKFKRGEVLNLCNCDLFDEGFDVPKVSVVIMLRKTLSYNKYKQIFGRMLRVCEGKDYGILIDHVGNVAEHSRYGQYPHDDPEWSLADWKELSESKSDLQGRICVECFCYYVPKKKNQFVCPECNHMETPAETNTVTQEMIKKDVDLIEMDNEFIKKLLAERDRITKSPEKLKQDMIRGGASQVVVNSAVKRHTKRLEAQKKLRTQLQAIGVEVMERENWELKTFQQYFEKKFKVNIFKAQTLSEKETIHLLMRLIEWKNTGLNI